MGRISLLGCKHKDISHTGTRHCHPEPRYLENQAQDTPGPFVLQANIHVSKEQNIAKDSTKLIRIQKAISVEDTDVRVVDFSKDQMISQHVTEQGTMQTMNTLRDDVKLDEEAKKYDAVGCFLFFPVWGRGNICFFIVFIVFLVFLM